MAQFTVAHFADLRDRVGQEVAVSDWMEVPQAKIDLFAEATDDRQWIHVDPERARSESPYGTTVAHGFMTLALLAPLFDKTVVFANARMGVNYGLNRVRFTAPVPAGSQIRGRFKLLEFTALDSGAQMTWAVTIEIAGSERPACIIEWMTRRY